MAYFKDPNGGIHFLSDADIAAGGDKLLPPNCISLSDADGQAAEAAFQAAQVAAVPPIDPITSLANQIKSDPNGLAAIKQVLGL